MSVDSSKTLAHGEGAADHDEPYTWGLPPTMYVAPRQLARMMVLRSRMDNRQTLRRRMIHVPPSRRGETALDISLDKVSRPG